MARIVIHDIDEARGRTYNPGLVRFKGRWFCSFRTGALPDHCRIAILDENFQARTSHKLELANTALDFDHRGIEGGVEDARLFLFQGRLFCSYAMTVMHPHWMRTWQGIGEIDETGRVIWSRLLRYPQSQWFEKNWMMFEFEGRLLCTYASQPEHAILDVNIETGECSPFCHTTNENPWPHGPMRGGTPPVRCGDRFVSVFHSSVGDPRTYFGGFYEFEAAIPFRITGMSRRPLFVARENKMPKAFYEGGFPVPHRVVFPTALVDEGDYWRVAYGHHDVHSHVTTVGKDIVAMSYE